jgi:hypothetical protein
MLSNIKELFKTKLKDIDLVLLALLIFFLPFERIPSLELWGITIRISMIVGIVVILRAAYLVLSRKIRFKLNPLYIVIGVFLAWVLLIVPESINIKRALEVFLFDGFVIFLAIAVSLLMKKEYIKYLLSILFFVTLLSCIFAYYQFFGDIIGLPYYYTGLAERYTSGVFGFPRVQAFSLEPLYFGSFLLIGTMSALALLTLKNQEVLKKRTNIIILFVFTNIIFITTARSAIYALVLGIISLFAIALIRKKAHLKDFILPLLVIIASFGFALLMINYGSKLPIDVSKTFGKKGVSAYARQLTNIGLEGEGDERVQARKEALKLLSQDRTTLIIGIGPGQFGPTITKNQIQDYGWPIVNNLPLEILLESGIPGIILITTFLIILIVNSFYNIKPQNKIRLNEVFSIGLMSYLITQFIQYQAFSTLYVIHLWVVVGLMIGLLEYKNGKNTN